MYAITATSYRAIRDASDVAIGETAVDTVPRSLLDSIAATETAQRTNTATLRDRADTAIQNLRDYRDLASPTNAQTVAVVKLMCRVCISLIRLAIGKLEGTD
jgi:hypothetical protein